MSDKERDKDKDGLSFEGVVPIEEAVRYIQNLCDGLTAREVNVQNGAGALVLRPTDSVSLKIKARGKKEQSLRFEITWQGAAIELPSRFEISGPAQSVDGKRKKTAATS